MKNKLSTTQNLMLISLMSILIVVFGYFARYGFNLLLARILKADAYGDYACMIRVVFFGAVILLLGADDATLRFMPEYISKHEWGKARGYLQRHTRLILFASMVFVFFMAITMLMFFILHQLGYRNFLDYHPAVFGLWFIPLFAIIAFEVKLLRGLQCFGWPMLIFKILPYLIMALGIGIFVETGSRLTIFQVLAVYGFALFFIAFLLYLLVKIYLPREVRDSSPRYLNKLWAKVGSAMMLTNLVFAAIAGLDLLMLEIFGHSEAEVGIFAAIIVICESIKSLYGAVTVTISPRISTYIKDGDIPGLQYLTNIGNFSIMLAVLPLFVAIVIWGKVLLAHFGAKFVAGYPALILVAVTLLIMAQIDGVITPLLKYSGRQNLLAIANLVSLCIMIILGVILIPNYGIYGAVACLIVSRLVVGVSYIMAAKKYLPIKVFFFA